MVRAKESSKPHPIVTRTVMCTERSAIYSHSAVPTRVGPTFVWTTRMFMEMPSLKGPLDATRHTALIVEDDPRLQRAMAKELARMDFHVLLASHYDGAVRHLAQLEPHVVCIDIGLPNKSGYELCEHIRGALGLVGVPILMTSEYGSCEDMAHAEESGGDVFLRKPFSMRRFRQCVESLSSSPHQSLSPMHELHLRWKPAAAHLTRRSAIAGHFAAA
jgi:two-component system OmpR family response regulator